MSEPSVIPNSEKPINPVPNQAKTLTIVIYALQAASFIVGLTFLVAVIINYIKRDDVRGTWLESHFRWQIRTFWFCLLWGLIGALLSAVVIGVFILLANAVWVIYRIAKGWINVADNKPMYSES
ncbi:MULTISPECIES: hypothetical protein [unclassified Methylophaga]|jgi:uncharacterized membrane protein|uniref:DUF4870 family protein n=1 Tax=unclassified Methylophaga TaxID=2629249 RepID=UPI000C8CD6C8|nr:MULTISPECIES: hypothetical protein [unclassified Methylophaga]MAK65625.1 hypothetical protein [Methylophaga sp.]MAY16348.1 hypothetical protein [Methylophaga sp.]MBN45152.1 hypothetical protein [Methylophaga sp.]HAO23533.1 hypothetical protein [Methylophaga sp.]HCD06574.1 hypothetical protein [Methylophaga sp.]|tara:strand:+ start:28912 stop:29283 length:372 start_codon:yes stop_codon:yes gene_type:complete